MEWWQTYLVIVSTITMVFGIIAYFQRRPTVKYNKEKLKRLKEKQGKKGT